MKNFSFRQLKKALTSFFLTELEGPRPLQEFIKKTNHQVKKRKEKGNSAAFLTSFIDLPYLHSHSFMLTGQQSCLKQNTLSHKSSVGFYLLDKIKDQMNQI